MHFKILSARMIIANYDNMEGKDLKQIICEMCGSNKLIKKNGIYECQYCGCQYTLEEARKLMVEGTVKIDDSDKVLNWLKLADSAYSNSSWEEAHTYYCKVLEVYPDEWRSIYRKALSIGWQSTLANVRVNETIGGISDGFKALLASDNKDNIKARGIISIEQDLLDWVCAFQSASVKHAAEYTKSLESACYDYYQRSALMALVIEFAISLFRKFTIINIEDIELADGIYEIIVGTSDAIGTALCSKFRPLVGKRYSTFWQGYFDDYRNVYPTEEAKNAYSKLRIATEDFKRVYPKWKHERILKDNPDYDKNRIYNKALKLKKSDFIESLEEAVSLFGKITEYKDSEHLAAECRDRLVQKKYDAALRKRDADNLQSLSEAATQFEEIADYKDSNSLANECKKRIEELTTQGKLKKKRVITIGVTAILLAFATTIIIMLVGKLNTERRNRPNYASLDMSTSLIKGNMIIPADEAYNLLIDRILGELGDGYSSQSIDDGSVGILKDGETRYSYIIACSADSFDPNYVPIDSKVYPKNIIIFDCTTGNPNPDEVAKVMGFFADNESSSTIQPVLSKQIKSFPNKSYPDRYVLSLDKKGFYFQKRNAEGYYKVALRPDYYDYSRKLGPKLSLYLFFYTLGDVDDDGIEQLTDKQAKYLLDYYMDHELDYFANLDALVKQSGMNDVPELSTE